jgi:hypothetical protein
MKIKKVNEINYSTEITKVDSKKILDSVPVQNNRDISDWFIKDSMKSYREGHIGLLKNLISELTELFGPYNKGLRLEFLTKLWVLKYKFLIFNVFTAKGKGTSIEVCDMTHDDVRIGKNEKEIIEFLEELHKIVNNEKN